MAKLVLEVIDGSPPGQRTKLSGPVVVGSGEEADITLADFSLAPRHARISPDGDGALVEDLGSESGTFVDELPVHEPILARTGDEIRVGLSVLALLTKKQADGKQPIEGGDAGTGPLRVDPTAAAFIPDAVRADLTATSDHALTPEASARDRYGPLATWTDERVKHQTFAAAFGILGVVALVLMVFFID